MDRSLSTSPEIQTGSSSAGASMAKNVAIACLVLLSACGHLLAPDGHVKQAGPMLAQGAQQLDSEPRYGGRNGGSGTTHHQFYRRRGRSPRILTLLTTYSNRTAYAKANREAMEGRNDGYESVVSARTVHEVDQCRLRLP